MEGETAVPPPWGEWRGAWHQTQSASACLREGGGPLEVGRTKKKWVPQLMEGLLAACLTCLLNTIITITYRLTEFWFALHWMIGILVTLFFFSFFFLNISYFYLCMICQSKDWGSFMLCKVYVLPRQIVFVMLFRRSWIIQLVIPVQSSHFTRLSFSTATVAFTVCS